MNHEPVLYAEDEESDALFMERAFRLAGVSNGLVIAQNGQLAIDYLTSLQGREPATFPRLVLLDLNLPLKSGLEVLKWIRSHPLFRTLPTLLISSSDQDRDIHQAYAHGANGYLVKPSNPTQLQALVKALNDYWLIHNYRDEIVGELTSTVPRRP